MTIEELISYTRTTLLDDTVEPYFWSDDELLSCLNQAELSAAKRTNLIFSNSNSFSTQIGVNKYNIQKNTKQIVRIVINNKPLTQIEPNYITSTLTGNPFLFVVDLDNTITLYPTPNEVYTCNVLSVMFPVIKTMYDELEIPEQYHFGLSFGIAYQALKKEDEYVQNLSKALQYEQEFTNMFGIEPTATALRNRLHYPIKSEVISGSKHFGFF